MQTCSPTPFSRKPASATQPPPSSPLPPGPGRLQLLPPTQIVAEHVDGCVLTSSDMNQFAGFLAEEFEYDQARAMWEPSIWYQDQVGSDICSEQEAILLRKMTIERCCSHTKLSAVRSLLAKSARRRHSWWLRFSPAASDLICAALGLVVMLLVIFLAYTGEQR